MLDDEKVIVSNPSLNPPPATLSEIIKSSFSGDAGHLKRPVSMFSFAVNSYLAGNNAFYLKLTNLLIHLLNGILLFVLSWILFSTMNSQDKSRESTYATDPYIASIFAASIWLLHPLNVSSVLYISQRMALLSAFFTLLGMLFYCLARICSSKQKTFGYLLSVFLICWPLATLSKENGILLPVYLLLIEYFFFKFRDKNKYSYFLIIVFAGLLFISMIAAIYFFPAFTRWIETGYHARPFTLSERLLTEGRVLWFYISLIFLPTISRMGLYHDDFSLSTGIIDPSTTLLSLAGIVALFTFCMILRKKHPVISWGVFIFFSAHAIESTVIPLELIFEHRNYFASIGLLIPLGYYASKLSKSFKTPLKITYILFPVVILLGVLTAERSSYWGHPFLFYSMEADNHPRSSRANYDIGVIYAKKLSGGGLKENEKLLYEAAKKHFIAATQNSPDYTGGLFGLINMDSSVNYNIDDILVTELEKRLSSYPLSTMSTTWLSTIVNCKIEYQCTINHDVIQRLINAAINNEFTKTKTKTILLSIYAGFYANTLKDYDSAIGYSREAIALMPNNPLLHLNISQLYMATNQFMMAEDSLNKATTLDSYGQYAKSIMKSKDLLEKLRQGYSENIKP